MADLPVREVVCWDGHGLDTAVALPNLHCGCFPPLGRLPVAEKDVRQVAWQPCASESVRADFGLRGEGHRKASE
eukprot:4634258-Heterocapsa_arctica.AAC.1